MAVSDVCGWQVRAELTYRVLVLSAVAAVAVALYFIDPMEWAFMPKCPFKMITGFSCPGCGFQRAVHALLHGDVAGAVGYNLFLVYAGPYALALLVQRWVLTGSWQRRAWRFLEDKRMVAFYVVMFFIWMVVRNVIGI